MQRQIVIAQIVLFIAWTLGAPALAQQTLRIAAIVNEEVISVFDVSERIKIVLLSSGITDSPEQRQRLAPRVLGTLVDEALQTQAADQFNISVTERDMGTAFREIEGRNGIPEGQLLEYLRQSQVNPRAMEKQVRAMIAWQKLLARRIVPTVEIGQDEINVVIDRIASIQGQTQYRVSEIVLAIEQPRDAPDVLDLAERLIEQIGGGASFAAVAQQFSQSSSAAVGGDLGWIQPGQFEADIDLVLAKAQPGELIGPVRRPDSVQIYHFTDRQTVRAPGSGALEVSLRQMLLPVGENAPEAEIAQAVARAGDAASQARNCGDFARIAVELGTAQADQPARIRMADLSTQLQQAVNGLAPNQTSQPLITPYGVQLIMLCERHDAAGTPDRDRIAEQLARERIDMLARRYIRDLRRAAFIDLRI